MLAYIYFIVDSMYQGVRLFRVSGYQVLGGGKLFALSPGNQEHDLNDRNPFRKVDIHEQVSPCALMQC
jgi:hypothetical protein